jgi:hypothetical protein
MRDLLFSGLIGIVSLVGCQAQHGNIDSKFKPGVVKKTISYEEIVAEKPQDYRKKKTCVHWKLEMEGEDYSITSKKVLAGYDLNNYKEFMNNHEVVSHEVYIYKKGTIGSDKLPIEDLTGAKIGYAHNMMVWHAQSFVDDDNGRPYLKSTINSYNFVSEEKRCDEIIPVFTDFLRGKLVQSEIDKLNGVVREEVKPSGYGYPRFGPFIRSLGGNKK